MVPKYTRTMDVAKQNLPAINSLSLMTYPVQSHKEPGAYHGKHGGTLNRMPVHLGKPPHTRAIIFIPIIRCCQVDMWS